MCVWTKPLPSYSLKNAHMLIYSYTHLGWCLTDLFVYQPWTKTCSLLQYQSTLSTKLGSHGQCLLGLRWGMVLSPPSQAQIRDNYLTSQMVIKQALARRLAKCSAPQNHCHLTPSFLQTKANSSGTRIQHRSETKLYTAQKASSKVSRTTLYADHCFQAYSIGSRSH